MNINKFLQVFNSPPDLGEHISNVELSQNARLYDITKLNKISYIVILTSHCENCKRILEIILDNKLENIIIFLDGEKNTITGMRKNFTNIFLMSLVEIKKNFSVSILPFVFKIDQNNKIIYREICKSEEEFNRLLLKIKQEGL
ncbi:MAG: hypothetical protein AB9856_13910 [Cellulosilyticaceae bacterium]